MAVNYGSSVTCSTSPTSPFKGSPLNCLRSCDSQIVSINDIIKNNRKEINSTEHTINCIKEDALKFRALRESQQEQILNKTKDISVSDTECLRIKNKLPFLRRRSILNNIDRLEALLRMNNYKPKEEQLVLKEITKKRNSLPLLDEYKQKVGENKRLRDEKARLVYQRNSNYNKLQAMYERERYLGVKLLKLREILKNNIKELDDIEAEKARLLQIAREKLYKRQQRKQKKNIVEQTKSKELKENKNSSKSKVDHKPSSFSMPRPILMVRKNIYGPEISVCKVLLSYANSLAQEYQTNPGNNATDNKEEDGNDKIGQLCNAIIDMKNPGKFYTKPKIIADESNNRSKKKKNKKLRVNYKKEMSHPPDVISQCLDLGIRIPKTIEDIKATLKSINEKLNYYHLLNEQVHFNDKYTQSKNIEEYNKNSGSDVGEKNNISIVKSDAVMNKSDVVRYDQSINSSNKITDVKSLNFDIRDHLLFSDENSTFSDVESGMGDDNDSMFTQITDDFSEKTIKFEFDEAMTPAVKSNYKSVPTTRVSINSSLMPLSQLTISESDPSVSTDSTSSGCSSTYFRSISSPPIVPVMSMPEDVAADLKLHNIINRSTMLDITQQSNVTAITMDSHNISVQCSKSLNSQKNFSFSKLTTPTLGPTADGFCALPPLYKITDNPVMNYAAAASKKN